MFQDALVRKHSSEMKDIDYYNKLINNITAEYYHVEPSLPFEDTYYFQELVNASFKKRN